MAAKQEHVTHEFGAFYDENSKILILGTIPSPKSREMGFYYGHPRNRFWKVLAQLFDEPFPETVDERKAMLKKHGIALWDVLASCEIHGAADSSIKDPVPNDMDVIFKAADIKAVFTTGTTAMKLYMKHCYPACGISATGLPSTSPANCACSYEKLVDAYSQILKYL